MTVSAKLQIYQGIILYLLESTHYNLKNIAEFTDSPITHIQALYRGEKLSLHCSSEHKLMQMYQIVLGIQNKRYAHQEY